jgi:hypothetical protein
MRITYRRIEPERNERRRYAVLTDGCQIGVVRKFSGFDFWDFIDRDDLHTPRKRRQVLAIRRDRSRMDMRLRVAEVNGIVHNGRAMLEVVLTNEPRTIGEPPVEVIVRSQTFRESDFTRDRLVRVTVEPQP